MRRPEASATVAVGPVHFFLDETGFDDRSRFAAIACAILDDPPAVREEIRTQRARLLREPFLLDARAARVLAKKGFHYSTDPMEVKLRFIEFLMGLTFEAYVCFVEKPVPFDGRCWLDKLFGRLLFDRVRGNRSRHIEICFEQTDSRTQKRLAEVCQLVAACAMAIRRDRGGLPVAPSVRSAGKEEPCLAVADYVCGIVHAYLEATGGSSETHPMRNLARIRSKLRVIHDFGTDRFFTRRNPLP